MRRTPPQTYRRFDRPNGRTSGRGPSHDKRCDSIPDGRIQTGTGPAAPLLVEIDRFARQARLDLQLDPGPGATRAEGGDTANLGLTGREREVLGLIATGWSNQEIADALFISRKTASVHASNIFDKLGAANRVEAAAIAHRLGLDVDAPPPPRAVT